MMPNTSCQPSLCVVYHLVTGARPALPNMKVTPASCPTAKPRTQSNCKFRTQDQTTHRQTCLRAWLLLLLRRLLRSDAGPDPHLVSIVIISHILRAVRAGGAVSIRLRPALRGPRRGLGVARYSGGLYGKPRVGKCRPGFLR
jgi:hypothetical protein